MPTTITAYTTFTPNTKARATEVNTNFSNHRGTLLPINTDTASASDSTHDLGTSSHRWKDLYAGSADLLGSTSTVNLQIVPNTSSTLGGFAIQAGTSTAKCLDWFSTGADLLLFGTTIASFNSSGLDGALIQTNTIPRAALAANSVISFSATNTGGASFNTSSGFSPSQLTLSITTGNASDYVEFRMGTANTNAGAFFRPGNGCEVMFFKGSTEIRRWGDFNQGGLGSSELTPESFSVWDQINTTGSAVYSVQGLHTVGTVSSSFAFCIVEARKL